MRRALLLTMLLTATVTASDEPQLTVFPRILIVRTGVRVTCRVPRRADNRWVRWGFTNWRSAARQLEGEDAPITWETTMDSVPCDIGEAFCEVGRAGKSPARVSLSVEVVGCQTFTSR